MFKWDGDQWVYQIISEFNDPNDCTDESQGRIRPDGPGCMQVIGDGVNPFIALSDSTQTASAPSVPSGIPQSAISVNNAE